MMGRKRKTPTRLPAIAAAAKSIEELGVAQGVASRKPSIVDRDRKYMETCMTSENIKIEFSDGSVIIVDDGYQNETLRKSWFDKVRSDIPRLQAALGRRYPTLADYQAELARVEELIRIELRADMDRFAQVAIFSSVMGNASVEEFVARISHKMAT